MREFDRDDRLVNQENATRIERAYDFLRGVNVAPTLRLTLEARAIGLERAAPLRFGGVERFLCTGKCLAHAASVARRRHPADGHGRGDRAGGRLHDLVAHARKQAVRGDPHVVLRAVLQYDAELVAGKPSEMILPAQLTAYARCKLGDHIVRDIESIGIVDAAETVDRQQHEAAGRAKLECLVERRSEHFDHVPAIELAGERIEAGQMSPQLIAFVTLVDDANYPVSTQRPAVGAGEPASVVLDPLSPAGIRAHRILYLIANAGAFVGAACPDHRVEAGLAASRFDELGEATAGSDCSDIGEREHLGDITIPHEQVGIDPPFISDLPHRRENLAAVEHHARSGGGRR